MYYVIYEIENIEPIKQTSSLMQTDNEFSKSYISGANIRGAFIANYILQNKIADLNKDINRNILLKDGISFLNAYPIVQKNRTLPFPRCYYAEKDNMKTFNLSNELSLVELGEELEKDKYYDKVKCFEFAKWNNEELEIVEVEKSSSIHIRKGFKDNNKLFRYESIKKGQKFQGIISCKTEESLKLCKQVLQDGTFYIGGSKGSGYGLCKVKNIKTVQNNPEIQNIDDLIIEEGSQQLIIIAISDMICRNEIGEYKTYIDEEYLKNVLGLEDVILKESFVDTDYLTGFNNKWGYRIPNVLGIKSGSTFVYEIKGDIDREKVLELMNKGVGERKNEGFGRIVLLGKLPFNTAAISEEKTKNNKVPKLKLENNQREQLKLILDRIYKERLKNQLPEKVLELTNKLSGQENIKKSQWGKLFNYMFLLEGLSQEIGIHKLKAYFENIYDKKLNTELKYAFEKIKINDEKLIKYILDELNNTDVTKFEIEYLQSIQLGSQKQKVKSNITKEEIYNYKIKYFKEFFRLQLRDKIRRGEK